MKYLSILSVFVLCFFISSCGGGSDKSYAEKLAEKAAEKAGDNAEEIDKMQDEVKEMAERAEEMEKEDDALLSDKNIEMLGLTATERKWSDETWEKAKVLAAAYKEIPTEELREMDTEKIEKMILDAGFEDIETAKVELQKVADSRDHNIGISMDIGSLKTVKLIDGEEAYEKEMKELGEEINEHGYTAEDLKVMDENVKMTVSIIELLYRLNN